MAEIEHCSTVDDDSGDHHCCDGSDCGCPCRTCEAQRDFESMITSVVQVSSGPIPTKALRCMVRDAKRSPDNRQQWSLGLRIGYWPCLRGPYVQVAVLCWVVDLWYGLPSYKKS